MDNIPKVLEMLGLGDLAAHNVSPDAVEAAGMDVCARDWEDLLEGFPGYMPYRAQRACFGAAYIHVLMTDVYGIRDAGTATSFAAVDSMETHALSWALGAAVHMSLEIGALRPFAV